MLTHPALGSCSLERVLHHEKQSRLERCDAEGRLPRWGRLQEELHSERQKYQRWHAENVRRKTNYVPWIFNFLKLLAEKGQLQGVIDRARRLEGANKK